MPATSVADAAAASSPRRAVLPGDLTVIVDYAFLFVPLPSKGRAKSACLHAGWHAPPVMLAITAFRFVGISTVLNGELLRV
jgi:hypothetical protein